MHIPCCCSLSEDVKVANKTPLSNRSLEEVDEMFEKKIPAWRSKSKHSPTTRVYKALRVRFVY
jgi:hypothetical protein